MEFIRYSLITLETSIHLHIQLCRFDSNFNWSISVKFCMLIQINAIKCKILIDLYSMLQNRITEFSILL